MYSSHGHITQRVPENDKKPEIIWDQERKGKIGCFSESRPCDLSNSRSTRCQDYRNDGKHCASAITAGRLTANRIVESSTDLAHSSGFVSV